MPKMSKLCHVVYHSNRLDGAKVFILLYALVYYFTYITLDQNATTKKNNASYEKVFVLYSEKDMTSYFDLRFSGVLRIIEEN